MIKLRFLMYYGFAMMAYFWAIQVEAADKAIKECGEQSKAFYEAKLASAEFYYDRLLPRASAKAAVKPISSTVS
jgi:hypothetical protein